VTGKRNFENRSRRFTVETLTKGNRATKTKHQYATFITILCSQNQIDSFLINSSTIMNFHLFSLNPNKRQPHQERSAIELHAVIKSSDQEDCHRPILVAPPSMLRRALYTIEEHDMDGIMGAPRVTIRKRHMKEEPIVNKSPTFQVAFSKKRQHRRFKAMDEDDFSKITMVCDDLHNPGARSHTRSPAIWK
jgi:hypothetical protein